MLSRAKLVKDAKSSVKKAAEGKEEEKRPQLEDFLNNRDFTGAQVLLDFQRQIGEKVPNLLQWVAYCAYHLGDYKKALDTYRELLKDADADPVLHLYAACCMYHLGMYDECEAEVQKGPQTRLHTRLLFHLAYKKGEEAKLMKHHQKISDSTEDQLSLAALHCSRGNFQDAMEIYKRLMIEYRDYQALQAYMALCYYKLDYYDHALELLQSYGEKYPNSVMAANLKACNHFKLYDGAAAEAVLKPVVELLSSTSHGFENDLIQHNLTVFRGGEGALQVLPPLMDVVPEAKLNLVISHLRHGEISEAYELMKDVEPTTPPEYILKGIVNVAIGQQNGSAQHLKLAQQFFQVVGSSASEMDTIPGRQCMASCFILMRQFDEVLVYLNSIKEYCNRDPNFNFNHGVSLAASNSFKEAEEALHLVSDDLLKSDYVYISTLARCYIMNGHPNDAWDLYLKMESNHDSFNLLVLIANDCYKMGSFYYAAKAFDVLQRLDPNPEYWDGKRGACAGVFQMVVARKAKREQLRDVINMLRSNTNTPQADLMVRIMTKWLNEKH